MPHILETFLRLLNQMHPDLRTWCKQHRNQQGIITSAQTFLFVYAQMNPLQKDIYTQLNIQLCAMNNWRYTKSIYYFDDILFAELIEQRLTKIPIEILKNLPENSLYIEIKPNQIQDKIMVMLGFFVQYDEKDGERFLRFTFIEQDRKMTFLEMPLSEKQTIQQVIDHLLKDFPKTIDLPARHHFEKRLRMAMNLTLYLCAENADYSGRKKPSKQWRREEPKAVKYYILGANTCRAIRQYQQQRQQGKSIQQGKKCPHIRSGHWHLYWIGKRGKQTSILHWLDPIWIHKER